MDVVGAKVRVLGDAVLDSDSWVPQVAAGVEIKDTDAGGLKPTLQALGAHTNGFDYYLSATKLFLAQGLLVNGTLRTTKANQNGLLGFGGTGRRQVPARARVFGRLARQPNAGVRRRVPPQARQPEPVAAGRRAEGGRLGDVFTAWAPTKNVSVTIAYVQLGHIVPAVATKRQAGGYASAQFAF